MFADDAPAGPVPGGLLQDRGDRDHRQRAEFQNQLPDPVPTLILPLGAGFQLLHRCQTQQIWNHSHPLRHLDRRTKGKSQQNHPRSFPRKYLLGIDGILMR